METFVVKVWRPGGDEHLDGRRGTVVHLPTGRGIAFAEAEALITFLVGPSTSPGPTTVTLDQDEIAYIGSLARRHGAVAGRRAWWSRRSTKSLGRLTP